MALRYLARHPLHSQSRLPLLPPPRPPPSRPTIQPPSGPKTLPLSSSLVRNLRLRVHPNTVPHMVLLCLHQPTYLLMHLLCLLLRSRLLLQHPSQHLHTCLPLLLLPRSQLQLVHGLVLLLPPVRRPLLPLLLLLRFQRPRKNPVLANPKTISRIRRIVFVWTQFPSLRLPWNRRPLPGCLQRHRVHIQPSLEQKTIPTLLIVLPRVARVATPMSCTSPLLHHLLLALPAREEGKILSLFPRDHPVQCHIRRS